jgi:hypothetical protein
VSRDVDSNGKTSTGESASPSFPGFTPLDANYLYCPNQFFDLCLTSKSRGVVRVVSYVLRQTLGWLNSDGEPISQDIQVSYKDLIEKAGVSKGAIPKALQQAAALSFIECTREGWAKRNGGPGQSAQFRLRWDERPLYLKSFTEFNGFYTGDGHRTPVPNAFFDELIPNETLGVIKVVGAIIRHTIGYRNQFGGRRTQTPLSLTDLQRHTQISGRQIITEAIQHAHDVGYIQRVSAGKFTHRPKEQSKAVYAIRWLQSANKQDNAPKTLPASSRPKKLTSNGSKTLPVDHPNKFTSIEKTNSKDTFKQQSADFLKCVENLQAEGFDKPTATSLVEKRGVDVVGRQLQWLESRNPQQNRVGFLRKAIEEDWPQPQNVIVKEKLQRERQLEAEREAKRLAEEAAVAQQKKHRAARKAALLEIWSCLPKGSRRQVINAASERQESQTLREMIRSQDPATEKPLVQVLDELAVQNSLPTVSTGVETKLSGENLAADDRSAAPQKEKSVTD